MSEASTHYTDSVLLESLSSRHSGSYELFPVRAGGKAIQTTDVEVVREILAEFEKLDMVAVSVKLPCTTDRDLDPRSFSLRRW